MLAMHHYHVISRRVTKTDLVTTMLANNLSTTVAMLPRQVLEDDAIPEKNKTNNTDRILVQTYTFSLNEQILIPYLKVFTQPSHKQLATVLATLMLFQC